MGVRLAKIPEFQQQVLANPACANALGFDNTAFLPYLQPGTHDQDTDSEFYESEVDSDAYDIVFDSGLSPRGAYDFDARAHSSSPSPHRDHRRSPRRRHHDAADHRNHHSFDASSNRSHTHRLRRATQPAHARDPYHSSSPNAGGYGRHAPPLPHGRGLSEARLFSSASSFGDDILGEPFPEILQPGANGAGKLASDGDDQWGVGDTVYRVWNWFLCLFSSNASGTESDGALRFDATTSQGEIPAHEIERVLREQPEGKETPTKGKVSEKVSSAIAIATVIVIAVFLKRQLA